MRGNRMKRLNDGRTLFGTPKVITLGTSIKKQKAGMSFIWHKNLPGKKERKEQHGYVPENNTNVKLVFKTTKCLYI